MRERTELDTLWIKYYTSSVHPDSQLLQTIGSQIKQRREHAGLTLTQLAHEIGLRRAELEAVEKGESDISFLPLMKLFEKFETDFDTFVNSDEVLCPQSLEQSQMPSTPTEEKHQAQFKAIDLFAGIGGIRMGGRHHKN